MDNYFYSGLREYLKENIQNLRDLKYSKNKMEFTHGPIVSYGSYAPWEDDREFYKVYSEAKEKTLVDIYRCFELWELTLQLNSIKGDIIEVGVWKGGTGCVISSAAAKGELGSKVYLCDTFSGVVKAGKNDSIYKGGEHSDTSVETVDELLKKFNLKNYLICKGIFPDHQVEVFQKIEIKLLHIDVDTYESAKDCFDFSWPRMVKGGIVVFDDYGFWGCEGVTLFFNELRLDDGLKIYNINGHGIIIKK